MAASGEIPVSISPRSDLDSRIGSFDQLSSGLVLFDARPLAEVRSALESLDEGFRAHLAEASSKGVSPGPRIGEAPGPESEHRRFVVSFEQLWWFYRIVEADDHGGHRQALGQYGLLLAEALRRHLSDERAESADLASAGGPEPGDVPRGKA
ncbi:MAG: hypothetical protein ACLQD8_03260 [Thermoplasmata archaeon]